MKLKVSLARERKCPRSNNFSLLHSFPLCICLVIYSLSLFLIFMVASLFNNLALAQEEPPPEPPGEPQHIHSWTAGSPIGIGRAFAEKRLLRIGAVTPIHATYTGDIDTCDVASPPCSFPDLNNDGKGDAHDEVYLVSWSDGGAGGKFGWLTEAGEFVEDANNVTHYKAPEEPKVIYLTYTYEDRARAIDPRTNQYVSTYDDPAVTSLPCKLIVWDADITKCPPGEPVYQGTFNFTATIYPGDLKGTIEFHLTSSSEPGRCMNYGPESPDEPDLKFEDQPGFIIPPGQNRQAAITAERVNSATIIVTCYDYGAWGTISAWGTLSVYFEDEQKEYQDQGAAHLVGDKTKHAATIPLDENPANRIADSWPWNAGNATDDNDAPPVGDGTQGDGFSRYEEYRGFMVNGGYRRTNPTRKDVFVWDPNGLGTADFPNTGITVHHPLQGGEFELRLIEGRCYKIVNYKYETAHVQDQNAIYICDVWRDVNFYGWCFPDRGTPNQCDRVEIYTNRLHDDDPGGLYQEALAMTIGHECGHDINLEHHLDWGTPNCVMRRLNWNNIGHIYCQNNPGCLFHWRLH